MDEIKNTAVKKRKKKRSTNPAVRVLKILGTALLSIFLILIITCSIFATVLTIYVLNFADTTTTISLDKTETSNISRFLSVNPDYDEDDEDSQEYDLYYALKNSNKHVVWADLEDIPQYVQDAFVYTEDERFYSHDGVDFKRTFASFVNVFIPIYGGRQMVRLSLSRLSRTSRVMIPEILSMVSSVRYERSSVLSTWKRPTQRKISSKAILTLCH